MSNRNKQKFNNKPQGEPVNTESEQSIEEFDEQSEDVIEEPVQESEEVSIEQVIEESNSFELKLASNYDSVQQWLTSNSLRLPSLAELTELLTNNKNLPRGTFWSSKTYVDGKLIIVACIDSKTGKEVEVYSHKACNAIGLK